VNYQIRFRGCGAACNDLERPLGGIVAILYARSLDAAACVAYDDDAGRIRRWQGELSAIYGDGFGSRRNYSFARGAQTAGYGLTQRHGDGGIVHAQGWTIACGGYNHTRDCSAAFAHFHPNRRKELAAQNCGRRCQEEKLLHRVAWARLGRSREASQGGLDELLAVRRTSTFEQRKRCLPHGSRPRRVATFHV
jgi:hypothetical protein